METVWASQLNPILSLPLLKGNILTNISLKVGNNVINHLLGRPLIGWVPVRYHGSYAQLYDTQDTNTMSNLTLQLNASAPVIIDIYCF